MGEVKKPQQSLVDWIRRADEILHARLDEAERGRRVRESTRTLRQKVRHRVVVSESDYATTIRVLQRLVENLQEGEDL
jgi:hypothetical protein